jgi:site-specific DNA-methyltransferase (adenine-specific)
MIAAGDPNERPGVTEITKPSASIFGNAMQRRGTLGTGRWPANVAHDGSEEVLAGFPQTTTGKQSAGKARPRMSSWHSKDGRKTVNSIESAANAPDNYGDSGSAARFFYCAKASRAERDAGCEGLEAEAMHPIEDAAISTQSNRRCVKCGRVKFGQPHCECDDPEWVETAGSRSHNTHPTLKPIALTRWLATLILPPPLDEPRRILIPFAGVGSEMIGAMQAGWDEIVGVELHRKYTAIAKLRLDYYAALGVQLSLDLSATQGQPASTRG